MLMYTIEDFDGNVCGNFTAKNPIEALAAMYERSGDTVEIRNESLYSNGKPLSLGTVKDWFIYVLQVESL